MSDIDPSRIFTRQQVDNLLSAVINKTLLQVDNAKLLEQLDAYQVSIPIRRRTSTMKNKSVCVTSALYSVNTKTPIGCSAKLDELLKLKEKLNTMHKPLFSI